MVTNKATRKTPVQTPDEIVARHLSRDAINRTRQLIREAVPAADESVKWNAPSFSTADHFATFFLGGKGRTAGFQVILHLGVRSQPKSVIRSEIRDPVGLLEWRAPDRAVVTFRDEEDVLAKAAPFLQIVRQWAAFVTEPASAVQRARTRST